MKSQTVDRLLSLNKQFYQTFGPEFSATRRRLQPGVVRFLQGLAGDESILDLGCGNGELARELIRRGHRGRYLGVDFSPSMLAAAQAGDRLPGVDFVQADLLAAGWNIGMDPANTGKFDWVTAFAVLHHLPGEPARRNVLNEVHELLRTGGRFIHSEWQFLQSERLKSRIQPWDILGLSPEDVDPNDYLLDWRSGGRGLRFVHHFDEVELAGLVTECRFRLQETYYSDGANGKLSLYQVWEAE